MPVTPSLPELRHAPIQHVFRRVDDFICWTRPLFGISDYDCRDNGQTFRSSHRSLMLGGLHVSRTDYSTDIRMNAEVKDLVLFTMNTQGTAHFDVKGTQLAPAPVKGVLVISPTEGRYFRGQGGGLLLTVRPDLLLQTAHAMHSPMAVRRLRERLKQPLSFHAYGNGQTASLPLGLLQSLLLVDSLLGPEGTPPAALRLDDLINRQLVMILCPELLLEPPDEPPRPASANFELLLEWICGQLDQPISLTDLERQSGYSRRALQRAFHDRFGCGPMQWLRRRRLDQGLQQLTQAGSSVAVTAVAHNCGYLSLSSFSRDFTQAYGRRPSEVLRANRASPV